MSYRGIQPSFHAARWLLLCLLALVLSACAPAPATTAAESSAPPVLDIHWGAEPQTIDPALVTDRASVDLAAQLFEGLVAFDPVTAAPVPALAAEWDTSNDGLTYTFRLREGATWVNQQGEAVAPVTAGDVVFAIQRACNPATAAPQRHLLWLIRGCEAEAAQPFDPEQVAVRALDEATVEFTLATPASYVLAILGMPVAWPVPRAAVEQWGAAWTAPENLVTSGAYLLEAWQPGERLTLARNPRYWGVAGVAIERVNGFLGGDTSAALARYAAQELDAAILPPAEVPALLGQPEWQGELQFDPDPCLVAYGFTVIKPPLDNARVRRALSLATPRQALVDETLGGGQLVARHIAAPGTFGVPRDDASAIVSDAGRAQALLAEAGYAGGAGFPPITLLHPAGNEEARVAAAVAAGWRATLGIEVTVEARERPAFDQSISPTTPLAEAAHVWQLGWCAAFPDEHGWLPDAFGVFGAPTSPLPAPPDPRVTIQPGQNHLRRIPSRFEELVTEAATERDPDTRRELYAQAEQRLLLDEAALAPLYHPTTPILAKPWLRRTVHLLGGQRLQEWSLDMAARETARRATPPP